MYAESAGPQGRPILFKVRLVWEQADRSVIKNLGRREGNIADTQIPQCGRYQQKDV